MSVRELLSQRVHQAMIAAGIPADCNPAVVPSKNPQFGDYQANGAMGAAKQMKANPRALAQQILDQLDLNGIASQVEIAGPGFLNISLSDAWLGQQVAAGLADPQLGVSVPDALQTVVVDYSSPNLAKEMHVGHLRSTIIGDAIVRTLAFLGHRVIRQNHVGDWGTQFGMLIAHLEDKMAEGVALEQTALSDLETFYREAKGRFDEEAGFADRARDYVVKLQGGDAHCQTLWARFIDISLTHAEEIYRKLGVTLERDDVRAESAYNDQLQGVIDQLVAQGLAVDSDGAKVVFLEELADKEGNPSPMIVQKSGGGFLYATTDLAAARYRTEQLGADRCMYFIDARQSLHMKQVFTTARKAGFVGEAVQLEHLAFGTMLGEDGKPFKTRAGGTVKLADLLDEAVERANALIAEKNPALDETERAQVAQMVGIGAVKYADLSKTRTNDYVFSWESMLSFEGNTAPYLQYAHARICSLFRRAGIDAAQLSATIQVVEPQEKQLVLQLLQFGDVVAQVARDAMPHVLCNYLYELASQYMRFYEACPVLKEGVEEALRDSRLRLCLAVQRTLKQGLELLGIDAPERM